LDAGFGVAALDLDAGFGVVDLEAVARFGVVVLDVAADVVDLDVAAGFDSGFGVIGLAFRFGVFGLDFERFFVFDSDFDDVDIDDPTSLSGVDPVEEIKFGLVNRDFVRFSMVDDDLLVVRFVDDDVSFRLCFFSDLSRVRLDRLIPNLLPFGATGDDDGSSFDELIRSPLSANSGAWPRLDAVVGALLEDSLELETGAIDEI